MSALLFTVAAAMLTVLFVQNTCSTPVTATSTVTGTSSINSTTQVPFTTLTTNVPKPTGEFSDNSTTSPTGETSDNSTTSPTGETSDNSTTSPTGETSYNSTTSPTGETSDNSTTSPTGETSDNSTTSPTGETSDNSTTSPTGETSDNSTTSPTGETSDNSTTSPTGETSDNSTTSPTEAHSKTTESTTSQQNNSKTFHSQSSNQETTTKIANLKTETDSNTIDNITNEEPEEHEESEHEHPGVELIVVRWKDVEYPLIVTLVVILTGLSKLGFHYSHFLSSKVPESCVLILLGVISGVILYYSGITKDVKLYAPHLFFLYLLPPIILEAAYGLYDRTFAENIGGVLLFAVVGTVLNCFLIGLSMYGLYLAGAMEEVNTSFVQMLLFSALIVAVDPVAVLAVFQEVGVNDMLYFLVFGESLLNDGVTVVLYDVMQIFITMSSITAGQIFLGIAKFFVVVIFGLLIGVLCGLTSSFITKYTNSVKVVEPLIVFGFAYLSYVLSDMFEFSGIISIIACGIVQAHYTFKNVTKKSLLAIKFLSKVMSTASEIIIFLDLGIVTINLDYDWKTGFSLWALLLCIVYRFIVTYSLSACLNKFSAGRVRKIRLDEMFMISYGGLRGAVCFSLVALIDESHVPMKNLFVTTTLFIIFFTVFVQGGTIKWLVKKLRVKLAEGDPQMNLNMELSSHVFDYILAGVEQIVGYTTGDHHIKKKLDHIDNKIIRPKMLKSNTGSEMENLARRYEKLVMKEHYKNLLANGAKLPKVNSDMVRKLETVLDPRGRDDDDDSSSGGGCNSYQNLVAKMERQHVEENLAYGDNVHKFLAYTMDTVRDGLHVKMHDKNMAHNHEDHVVTQLRRKHRNASMISLRHSRNMEGGNGGQSIRPNSECTTPEDIHMCESTPSFQVVKPEVHVPHGVEYINEGQTEDEGTETENGTIVFTL